MWFFHSGFLLTCDSFTWFLFSICDSYTLIYLFNVIFSQDSFIHYNNVIPSQDSYIFISDSLHHQFIFTWLFNMICSFLRVILSHDSLFSQATVSHTINLLSHVILSHYSSIIRCDSFTRFIYFHTWFFHTIYLLSLVILAVAHCLRLWTPAWKGMSSNPTPAELYNVWHIPKFPWISVSTSCCKCTLIHLFSRDTFIQFIFSYVIQIFWFISFHLWFFHTIPFWCDSPTLIHFFPHVFLPYDSLLIKMWLCQTIHFFTHDSHMWFWSDGFLFNLITSQDSFFIHDSILCFLLTLFFHMIHIPSQMIPYVIHSFSLGIM